jgi:hypothetical protein
MYLLQNKLEILALLSRLLYVALLSGDDIDAGVALVLHQHTQHSTVGYVS